MPAPTTFEIFNDIDRGSFPTAATETAITYIGSIIGDFDIRVGRSIPITGNPAAEWVDVAPIRWAQLEADVNIVLTDRWLYHSGIPNDGGDILLQPTDDYKRVLGAAYHDSKMAIIDTAHSLAEVAVTTHEIGHLRRPENAPLHCKDPSCVMKATLAEPPITQTVLELPSSFMQRIGITDKTFWHATETNDSVKDFCADCRGWLVGIPPAQRTHRTGTTRRPSPSKRRPSPFRENPVFVP